MKMVLTGVMSPVVGYSDTLLRVNPGMGLSGTERFTQSSHEVPQRGGPTGASYQVVWGQRLVGHARCDSDA